MHSKSSTGHRIDPFKVNQVKIEFTNTAITSLEGLSIIAKFLFREYKKEK